MIYPCKDCEDRHFKCHSSCEKYLKVEREQKERNRKIKYENDADYHSGRVSEVRKWS